MLSIESIYANWKPINYCIWFFNVAVKQFYIGCSLIWTKTGENWIAAVTYKMKWNFTSTFVIYFEVMYLTIQNKNISIPLVQLCTILKIPNSLRISSTTSIEIILIVFDSCDLERTKSFLSNTLLNFQNAFSFLMDTSSTCQLFIHTTRRNQAINISINTTVLYRRTAP